MTEPMMNYDALLDDLAAYTESVYEPDYLDLMAEIGANTKVLQEKLERGKVNYEQHYRVRQTGRHIEDHADGDGHDIPKDALAQRKVWSGYLATSPTFRWQYLVKTDERDLISISAAAELLYGANDQNTRQRVRQMLADSKLTEYIDAHEPNPQHRRRVSRAEAETLKQGL